MNSFNLKRKYPWNIIGFALVAMISFDCYWPAIFMQFYSNHETNINALYAYMCAGTPANFLWKEEQLGGKRRISRFAARQRWSSIRTKESRGPPSRLGQFFFPSSTAVRDDFNRKITTRFRQLLPTAVPMTAQWIPWHSVDSESAVLECDENC